ncbi:MAG: PH domain-containing protein [bacterium]|nr:PH domain-containing protein [bacterium]
MLKLDPDEKILIVLRHHWISIVGPVLFVAFLLIVPLGAFPLVAASEKVLLLLPLFFFALSIWLLIVLALAFIFWIDYYLDVLIITSKRIINIDQIGLFRRHIAEFRLDNVQDVAIDIPNFMATFLRYGDLTIQTASESNFTIKEVPRVYEAKDLILKYSKKNVGSLPLGTDQA